MSLSKDNDDNENVAKKLNWCPFKPYRVYFDQVNLSNVGDVPGVEFLRNLSLFNKRNENSSSYVDVLHKTSH